jgi:hypothetical protein
MSARVLKGNKEEIAADLARITGEVREAIVFIEDPALAEASEAQAPHAPDLFDEMRPLMVDARQIDDSREAVYSRMDGE